MLEAKQSAGKVTKYLAASSEHSFYHIINIRAIVRDRVEFYEALEFRNWTFKSPGSILYDAAQRTRFIS